MTPEKAIESSVLSVLKPWIAAESARTCRHLKAFGEEYAHFLSWANYYGLNPSAGGHIVAGYLLELAADGVSLAELNYAAEAISFFYHLQQQYLDQEPITAAIALVAAQTAPNRVLN
jgi:hypothetical protein